MPTPTDPLLGTVLSGKYRVLARLGQGGFGTVYTVRHVHTGKHFAAKVLHADLAGNQRITERFWREAQTAALIEHENVVDIIDIGETPEGTLYFSMELLRGEPLADLLQREGALPWPRAQGFAVQIARALCAAHEKGVIHRDLKPANCLRIRRGDNPDFVKVLDFGIAKIVHNSDNDAPGLTSRGEVLGTPYYMAPEQAAGNVVDARADVFSFGVLLYEILTGQLPFQGSSRFEILTKMLTAPPPSVSVVARHGGLPPAIDALVAHALQPKPELRPASMAEVLLVLQGERVSTLAVAPERGAGSIDRKVLGFAATEAAVAPTPGGVAADSHSDLMATLPVTPKPPVAGYTELMKTTPQGKGAEPARRRRTLVAALAGLGVTGAALAAAVFQGSATDDVVVAPPVAPPPVAPPPTRPEPAPLEPLAPAPAPVVEPTPPPAPTPEPKPPEPAKAKSKATATTKKKPSSAAPALLITCQEALEMLSKKAPAMMTKCTGDTGITRGDRVTVSLSGDGATHKVGVTIVQSSSSSAFDSCLAAALERQSFPSVTGTATCRKQFQLRVP